MSVNSNRKGKEGELEFANLLKKYGYKDARRSQQYAGINNDADVVGLDGFHVEVKRVENLNVNKAYEQAVRDKAADEMAIVAHRKNYKDWKITLSLDDWLTINRSNDYYILYNQGKTARIDYCMDKAKEVSKVTGLKPSMLFKDLITVYVDDFMNELKED